LAGGLAGGVVAGVPADAGAGVAAGGVGVAPVLPGFAESNRLITSAVMSSAGSAQTMPESF